MSTISEVNNDFLIYLKLWGDDNMVDVTDDDVNLFDNGDGEIYITKWNIKDVTYPRPSELLIYTPKQVRAKKKSDKIKKLKQDNLTLYYDDENDKLSIVINGILRTIKLYK